MSGAVWSSGLLHLRLAVGLDQQVDCPIALILIHARQPGDVHVQRRPFGGCELRARIERPVATNANKIRSSWSVTRLGKEYCQLQGRYRPLLLDSLARVPSGQDLPFADLTGRFVQSDRDAVYKQDPAQICGGLGRS